MKLDFHSHGKLAKNLYFSKEYTLSMFDFALENDLDSLCLTEHFNTSQFDEVYLFIKSISKKQGDSLILENGLRIFPGIEIDVKEGGHILAIGQMDDILSLRKDLLAYIDPSNFISFSKLIDIFKDYPILSGAAHPFRTGKSGNLPSLDIKDLRELDFIDLNGKDLALYGNQIKEKTYEFAEKLDLPVVAGSDTHQYNQYGVVYNIFEEEISSINKLYDQVLKGKYQIFIHENISQKVRSANLIKRLLKEIDLLGGDYAKVSLENTIV